MAGSNPPHPYSVVHNLIVCNASEVMTGGKSSERALDRMLCFSLYAASRATTQAYRRVLKPWGLTYPQYLVLIELWESQPRTVSELGDDLMLDSGTLSPLLGRLESLGYLSRSRSVTDGRVVTIHLTDSGRDLQAELAHIPGEIARCMAIPPAGAAALIAELRDYTAGLQASTPAHD